MLRCCCDILEWKNAGGLFQVPRAALSEQRLGTSDRSPKATDREGAHYETAPQSLGPPEPCWARVGTWVEAEAAAVQPPALGGHSQGLWPAMRWHRPPKPGFSLEVALDLV